MLVKFPLVFRNVRLRPVEARDAKFILSLRMDPVLGRYISPTSCVLQSQVEWLEQYQRRHAQGSEYYFVIQEFDRDYGVLRLYEFRGDSFCFGSWLVKRRTPARVALSSLVTSLDFGFNTLGFVKTHFDVHLSNRSVKRVASRLGGVVKSREPDRVYYELSREAYLENRGWLLERTGKSVRRSGQGK